MPLGEIIYNIDVKSRTFAALVNKVGGELAQINQLFNPERRQALWDNGLRQLRPLMKPIERDTEIIAEGIVQSMVCASLMDGITLVLPMNVHMAAVVFPPNAQLMYNFYDGVKEGSPGKKRASISSTTLSEYKDKDSASFFSPSEGFKTSEGTLMPFRHRRKRDWVQHGGFWVNNNTGILHVLNYQSFLAARKRELQEREFMIEANWYMDSNHQNEITNRRNLQQARPYNCIGTMEGPGKQQRYYAITSGTTPREAIQHLLETSNRGVYGDITMRHLATMSTVLTNIFDADRWAMGGLEFYGGGVYIGGDRFFYPHHQGFTVHF